MHARSLVAAAAILALSCGLAAARDLTLVARAPTQDAIRQVFVRPFTAATAIAVQTESWEGGIDALRTQAKAPDNAWDLVMVDSDELATGCSRGPVREARLVGDRRQGPLPAAGGQRLRRRRRRREPGAGLGSRQVSRRAGLGGFLGCREVSRQARPAPRRARQPGVRTVRRRRVARRRLQGARDVRGRRSRVPPAGSAQALHRVVARRCRGGTHPGVRRRADDQRLGAGDRRGRTGPALAISACSGRRAFTRCRAGRS